VKLSSQNNELLSFTIYGNDFLLSIALPNTWNVDIDFARQNGINGFFYLRDYGINNSPAVIVLNLAYKPNEKSELEEWIEYDINNFLDYYDGFTVDKLDWKIINENNYRVVSYKLKNDDKRYLQYSAYLDVGLNYYVNIYVTITDKNKHDEIINDFKKCLENSRFTGIGVKVN
jgi:hypothetical protein